MLIDLLSTSNYVSYNIKIAEVLGLHTAIYLSELMNINDKAVRKNKVDGSYFTVDRSYLKSRTTFEEDEQQEIEQKLLSVGILEKSDKNNNTLLLNITVLTSLLMSENENLIKDVSKIVKTKKEKKTKVDSIKDNLKSHVLTSNQELRSAYNDWIESVYAKQGWMSVKSVEAGQKLIDNFTSTEDGKHDLDIALRILEIASIGGYRDIQWAINSYQDNYNVSYRIKNAKQDVNKKIELSHDAF